MEASRREAKRRKLEAVHPEQILVRQARERLNRLIGDLEELQRAELASFQQNLENDKREFVDKQEEQKETFLAKIQQEERLFFYNHDIQTSKFMSRMSRKKFQFERMQQELKEEFSSMEKHRISEFKNKQTKQKENLLSRKAEKDSAAPRSRSTSYEVSQLTAPSPAPCHAPCPAPYHAPGGGSRKHSCPPRLVGPGPPCTPPPSPVAHKRWVSVHKYFCRCSYKYF